MLSSNLLFSSTTLFFSNVRLNILEVSWHKIHTFWSQNGDCIIFDVKLECFSVHGM